jgi:hypothetical protein
MESIKLKFTDYKIYGIASLILWGGGKSCIEMKPFHIKDINKIKVDDLNDNDFGVQSIEGGFLRIYKNYSGFEVYDHNLEIGKVFNCVYDYINEL